MLSLFQNHDRSHGQACYPTLIASAVAGLVLSVSPCRAQNDQTPPNPSGSTSSPVPNQAWHKMAAPAQANSQTSPSPAPTPLPDTAQKAPEANPYPEVPVHPAKISMEDGKLTVDAENSDLVQILRKLSDICGMKVEGVNRSVRVFGVYGPANSREVLTSLLSGSGYNFVMVGGQPDGAPRELLLTAQKNGAEPALPGAKSPAPADEDGPDIDGPDPTAIVLPPPEPDAVPMPAEQPTPEEEKRMQDNLDRLRQQSNTNSQQPPNPE